MMSISRLRPLLVALSAPLALSAQATATSPAEVRVAARLLAITDARRVDTMLIDSVVQSSASWLRVQAVRAVGQANGRIRAPLLRRLMSDPDTAVANTAVFSAGLLRDTAGVSALTGALAVPALHREAAAALGRIGGPGHTVLIEALGATPTADILLALATARPLPVDRILPHLQSDDPARRWAATYVLTRTVTRDAAGALLAALPHAADGGAAGAPRTEASDVRAAIAKGLARAAVPDSLQSEARRTLESLLADPHPHVRIAAARAYASYVTVARDRLLAMLATDADANVRVAIAQAVGPVFGPDPDTWQAAWTADTSTMTRIALAQGLRPHGITLAAFDRAHPDYWGRAADPRQRATAASLGFAVRDGETIDRGSAFLRDPSPIVVRSAMAALASAARPDVVTQDATLLDWFAEAGTSFDDLWVRSTAIGVIGRLGRDEHLVGLMRAYRRALTDALPAARHAALQAIASIERRSQGASARWAESLQQLPRPTDARSLELGAAIPALAAWRSIEPARRSNADWEAVVRETILPSRAGKAPRATLVTTRGTIVIELFGSDAPLTVENLRALAAQKYFDGIEWHRVVPYFVAQAGDPAGTGSGGPGYSIRDELNRHRYDRGIVGMALSGPDTGGSQWFLTHASQPHLDAGYTVFGRVVEGLDVMDALVQWDRLISLSIR